MRRSTAQTDATEHSTDRCDGAQHRQIQRSTEQTDATEHSTDRCDRAKSIAIAMYKVVVQLGGLSLEIEEYQPSSNLRLEELNLTLKPTLKHVARKATS